jgi:hypothetical protein
MQEDGSMHWFTQMIEDAYQELGHNESTTAEFLGIKLPTLHKWRNGTLPSLPLAEIAVKKLGGDLEASATNTTSNPNHNIQDAQQIKALQDRIETLERTIRQSMKTLQATLPTENTHTCTIHRLASEDPPHYGNEPTPMKL